MRRVPVVVCLTILHLAEAKASAPGEPVWENIAKFAIVIGKNEPEDTDLATLRYADDDAVSMHQLFTEAGINSTLLVSPDEDTLALYKIDRVEKPTLKAVLRAFDKVSMEIKAAMENGEITEFILFYSGHGDVSDGEGFVVLENGRLSRSALLERIIARSPAHADHVIIDACKSYYMVFNKGPGGERRPFQQSFGASVSGKNLDRTGFVLSASSYEDSHEWERYQAGVFSYEVRSALRGGADANQDGQITYGELGAFVTTANQGIINPQFRPNFLVMPPGREPKNLGKPLLRWTDGRSSLLVDAAASGHFYIETTSGLRIADVHPAESQELTVHLPASRPLFVRRSDDREEGVLYTGKSVRLSALTLQPTTVSRKGALNIAFESLFSAPFGIASVNAYETAEAEMHPGTAATVYPNGLSDKHSPMKPLRQTLFSAAVGSLVVGGTMSILAYNRHSVAEESSQSDIPKMNQTIDKYNTAAVVLYSVAAAAGVSWLTLKLLSLKGKKRSVSFFPIAAPTELSLGLRGDFGKY